MRMNVWAALCGCVCIVGCTATRERITTRFEYVPPATTAVASSRQFSAEFDLTWEGVIAYFAETNTSIDTIEKASGIIVARRMVGSTRQLESMLVAGDVAGEQRRVTDVMEPDGWFGSANPSYVREHGKVASTSSAVIKRWKERAVYDVKLTFNVFCRPSSGGKTEVRLTAEYEALTLVHGAKPQPQSTGAFEATLLDYVEGYVASRRSAIP